MAKANREEVTSEVFIRRESFLWKTLKFLLLAILLMGTFIAGRAVGIHSTTEQPEKRIETKEVPIAPTPEREKVAEEDSEAEQLVSDLIEDLEDTSEKVRRTAAKKLGELQDAAEPALPYLEKALEDTSSEVRHAAKEAIDRIEQSLEADDREADEPRSERHPS